VKTNFKKKLKFELLRFSVFLCKKTWVFKNPLQQPCIIYITAKLCCTLSSHKSRDQGMGHGDKTRTIPLEYIFRDKDLK